MLDSTMPAPGGLDYHYGIVAITPVLVALVTAVIGMLVPAGKAGHLLISVALLPAFAVQTALLAPHGIAWRCRGDHLGGLVLVHPLTIAVGLLLAIIIAAGQEPWRRQGAMSAWCLRITATLAAPTVMAPFAILAVEHDLGEGQRYRPLRLGGVVGASVAALWWPLPATICIWSLVALTVQGRWRWVAVASVLAVATTQMLQRLA